MLIASIGNRICKLLDLPKLAVYHRGEGDDHPGGEGTDRDAVEDGAQHADEGAGEQARHHSVN